MGRRVNRTIMAGVMLGGAVVVGRSMASPEREPKPFAAYEAGNEFYKPNEGSLPAVACGALALQRFVLGPIGRADGSTFGDDKGTYGDAYVLANSLRASADTVRGTIASAATDTLHTGAAFEQSPLVQANEAAVAAELAAVAVANVDVALSGEPVDPATGIDRVVEARSVATQMLDEARRATSRAYNNGCWYIDVGVINNPLEVVDPRQARN